ncbi:chaperonin family protein RbcX [Leptolyngbya sp. PCC 6406]|uniref:chaperonin family protein RbcX n=1 Tax=Leptolyngbya sp. PCC 6406 TaxID=1173264 RepID=UPI0002AC4566|nr:chaperonin family protein RbcX [Leptolyngbya sp. PCC 6406]
MDLKQTAKETAQVLTSYLTYQAVRIVMTQLQELNPPRSYWFNAFAKRESLQDGEAFLTALLQEQADLAMWVMTLRQQLAEEVTEFLPEMVVTGIQAANMNHRRHHLERITQMPITGPMGNADSASQDSEPPGEPSPNAPDHR